MSRIVRFLLLFVLGYLIGTAIGVSLLKAQLPAPPRVLLYGGEIRFKDKDTKVCLYKDEKSPQYVYRVFNVPAQLPCAARVELYGDGVASDGFFALPPGKSDISVRDAA
jgi:hypothetical protein